MAINEWRHRDSNPFVFEKDEYAEHNPHGGFDERYEHHDKRSLYDLKRAIHQAEAELQKVMYPWHGQDHLEVHADRTTIFISFHSPHDTMYEVTRISFFEKGMWERTGENIHEY